MVAYDCINECSHQNYWQIIISNVIFHKFLFVLNFNFSCLMLL
uniref:Uncharacterized protein n=1 Tax=Rhizophora mucronata TaxID=61149 RepID=A0A2P2P8P2_RHIMU